MFQFKKYGNSIIYDSTIVYDLNIFGEVSRLPLDEKSLPRSTDLSLWLLEKLWIVV